jgi:hypothetical protein
VEDGAVDDGAKFLAWWMRFQAEARDLLAYINQALLQSLAVTAAGYK